LAARGEGLVAGITLDLAPVWDPLNRWRAAIAPSPRDVVIPPDALATCAISGAESPLRRRLT
jgi:hypothetical protein